MDEYGFATVWQTFAISVAKFCQTVAMCVTTLCTNTFEHILPKRHYYLQKV